MIEFHDVEQRDDVWMSLRCGKIGGSEALGLTTDARMKTLLFKKAAELLTGEVKEIYQNEAMTWGIMHEDEARERYQDEMSCMVEQIGYITNDDYIYGGLSPDGRVSDSKYIEIKCPTSESHIETIKTNKIPSIYLNGQILWYFIIVPDIEEIDFISYDPRVRSRPIHIINVKRDDLRDDIDKLVSRYRKFEEKLTDVLKLFE